MYVFFSYNWLWAITPDMITFLVPAVIKYLQLCILGNVNHYRSGSSAFCNVKSFGQYMWYLSSVGNLVIPFSHRRGDIDHIRFLECICSQQMCKYLPGDANYRSGVNHCIGKPRNEVSGTGSARGKNYTYFARRSCIALRCMYSALLMPHK